MSSLIRLDNVCKTYQSSSSTNIALKQINFSINVGELTAIVGKSGSGKSTLMNILGLLDNLTEGSYFFNGVNVSHLTDDEQSTIRNESIGFVFQSFYLLPRSTILENVALPLSYRQIPPNQANHLASNMLKKVGLTDFDTRYPHQLSGGQQQRVAIARALVGNPAIILADEPTGALDSQTSHDIMQLLLKLNSDDNCTILIITHDEHISQQCKRVLHIKDGELFT